MATPIQSSPNVNNIEILLTGSVNIAQISRAIPADNPTVGYEVVETSIPYINGLFFIAGLTSPDGGGFQLLPYASYINNSSSPYGMYVGCRLTGLIYANSTTGNLEISFGWINANSNFDEGPFGITYYVMRNKL